MDQDIAVEYLPTERLTLYSKNARTHTDAQIRQIGNSIKAFGFINPIVVDANNVVVAGHGRLEASRKLGIATVPVIQVGHLTEDQVRAYRLADNKIAENAGWDNDLLKIELSYLIQVEIDIDVELTGFSTPEIDIVLGAAEPRDDEPPIPTLAPSSETTTQVGDVWQLGPHRLICGDCRESSVIESLMLGLQARLVFTDPPYNVPIDGHARGLGKDRHTDFAMACGEMSADEFTDFLSSSLGSLALASQDGALHYVCMDWRHMNELLSAGRAVYAELINLCIWNKSSGGMGSLYRSKHELVFVFKKGRGSHINNIELGKHGRYRTNVWDYPGVNTFGQGRDEALAIHPTVKPVQMIGDAILDASRRGEIVLDGFAGSGSTLLAAERTGRRFYGIEIDPRYVDVTLKRWVEHTGEQPVHKASGLSYAQRAELPSSPAEHCEA